MNKRTIFLLLLVSLLIVIGAALWASSSPDGLEWVAEKLGFIDKAQAWHSLMTDYSVPFIKNTVLSTITAGIVGLLLVFGLFKGISLILKRR